MPQIIPIKDLRDTVKISEMCHTTNEPIFVTRNGYGDMVILSLEYYDELLSRLKIYDEIIEGINQVEKGNVIDGDTAMAALEKKYAL